ncbi:hypothetical protein QJS10_CPA06g00774 [Acorus calamus]|uniref:Uncharacterized protein n=1 Tax=Acorus calamus TaxID=4465 RepID=A0AAV9EQI7_ACOCL|nr:hypothetical protein QJS10_CPA06g00774 [Acorus calamus]
MGAEVYKGLTSASAELNESYRLLPTIYLWFLTVWAVSGLSWAINTYRRRHFQVLLLLSYFISFYVIFHHIARNLVVLREQLSFIEDEDVHAMHEAVYTKYTMFKKFQGVMQIVVVAEIMIYMKMDDAADNYWYRLIVREWAQFFIFLYIGWTFRSRDMSPHFSVMPIVKSKEEIIEPPIYRIEMDARDFTCELHIAVPTPFPPDNQTNSSLPLVVVQQPRTTSKIINAS